MSRPATRAATGPIAAAGRSLPPDLARGMMLLIIAVVHAYLFAFPFLPGTGHTADLGAADTVTSSLVTLFAESRGYPMFAALFGYGLVMVARRQDATNGARAARRLLRRRGGWLIAFGFLHVVLLYAGDILTAYGILALAFAGAPRWTPRRILTTAALLGGAGALLYSAGMLGMTALAGSAGIPAPDSLPADVAGRATAWPIMAVLLALTSIAPVLIGVWAAQQRIMEQPEQHRALLRRTAAIGIPVAVLGGVPQVLIITGAIADPGTWATSAFFVLHLFTGYAGGFGYAALIALVAARLVRRPAGPGRIATALAACGQWSMTCYLLQSVAWFVLFYAYTLDLTRFLNVTAAVLVGVAVWLATVVVADLGHRAGRRGPAEALLRRLTYGAPAGAPPVTAGR
ncbi:putative membrane protein YeiB [Murinocardiopsis flavida]|uniref:Putative membrane protein YeiB n=1 Tax=Murinocardiopsis flavida TaxID=645275 RepID=A0A2P8DGG3_9ACTN|nr:DUF418 domain-containing protein [Murinocardiopsis flavida]PSK96310.1 putative membrane protein YeiB [Murinocardiopsis flavida]